MNCFIYQASEFMVLGKNNNNKQTKNTEVTILFFPLPSCCRASPFSPLTLPWQVSSPSTINLGTASLWKIFDSIPFGTGHLLMTSTQFPYILHLIHLIFTQHIAVLFCFMSFSLKATLMKWNRTDRSFLRLSHSWHEFTSSEMLPLRLLVIHWELGQLDCF